MKARKTSHKPKKKEGVGHNDNGGYGVSNGFSPPAPQVKNARALSFKGNKQKALKVF